MVVKSVTVNADASVHNVSNFEKVRAWRARPRSGLAAPRSPACPSPHAFPVAWLLHAHPHSHANAHTAPRTVIPQVFCEVAALEVLRGTPGVVPLIDYGLARDGGGAPGDGTAFLLVLPRYASSLAAWRRGQPGALDGRRARLYLAVFLQVRRAAARGVPAAPAAAAPARLRSRARLQRAPSTPALRARPRRPPMPTPRCAAQNLNSTPCRLGRRRRRVPADGGGGVQAARRQRGAL